MSEERRPVRRVVVTGAEGTIGTVLRTLLTPVYDMVALTLRPAAFPSYLADVTQSAALEPAFRQADAVVHLAGVSDVDAGWESVLHDNIIGTYTVLETARRVGVTRVVLASSNHAVGMFEAEAAPQLYQLDDPRTLGVSAPPRPDSLYGASKVFAETLGRLFVDRYGMSVVCLRLGTVVAHDDPLRVHAGRPFSAFPELTAEDARLRMRATWLSHRDCAELFRRALEADVDWAVVFGTSANPRQIWDLAPARDLLGYEPHDSAPL